MMKNDLPKMEELGFSKIGSWHSANDRLSFGICADAANCKNVLYAFVEDSAVRYIGKTARSLRTRLGNYKNPPKSGKSGARTNIRINQNITEAFADDRRIDIYALVGKAVEEYFGLPVDFAASIEDALIERVSPDWNHRSGKKQVACKQFMAIAEHQDEDKMNPKNERILPAPFREPRTSDYARQLSKDLKAAQDARLPYLIVRSGDLHKKTGGKKSYPSCCGAMRNAKQMSDVVESAPPKGNGGNLYIKYFLPRPSQS